MIHWTWILFFAVIVAGILRIRHNSSESSGDYSFDLESPLIVILLIAFVLIWGGIFWW
jgi:K+-transporting ATPase A subunit